MELKVRKTGSKKWAIFIGQGTHCARKFLHISKPLRHSSHCPVTFLENVISLKAGSGSLICVLQGLSGCLNNIYLMNK